MKLTPERQAKIVELVKAGNYRLTAARAAGISEAAFYRNVKLPRFRAFRDALDEAEAQSEAAAVERLVASDHRGTIAFLERRFAKHWGKMAQGPTAQAVVVSQVTAAEISREVVEFSREEMEAATAIFLARRRGMTVQELAAGEERLRGLYEEYDPEHPAAADGAARE